MSIQILAVSHSQAAEQRARQLLASHHGSQVIVSGPGLRGAARALSQLLCRRPRLVYLVDVGVGTALTAVASRLLGRLVVVDTGDLVFELERSRGERSCMSLAAVWLGERLALACAHHVVVRGRAHAAELPRTPTTFAPDLAPPGAAPADGTDVRHELGLNGSFVVGLVGAIQPARRLGICYGWDLVDALAFAPAHVRGLVVGDGDALEDLKQRAVARGVRDRCSFVGRVDSSEVARYLGAMDVAISTQTNDRVGAVRTTGKLPLYLACGCPVLATDVGEARRILGPVGWTLPYAGVVDPSYPRRLGHALATWASDDGRAADDRRNLALELYSRHFEPTAIQQRVARSIDALLATRDA